MKNKMYNVIFPVWFLIMIPSIWLIALPANFVIDTLVLIIAFLVLKVNKKFENYKRSILKVWIFGFVADIIGGLVLLISQFVPTNDFFSKIVSAVCYNPFDNIFAVIYVFIAILISAIFIYVFNYKISFKKLELDNKTKKKLAITLAIFTAPYLFFNPTGALYSRNRSDTVKESNVYIKDAKTEYSTYEGDTYVTRVFAESENYINSSFVYDSKLDKVSSSISKENGKTKVHMFISADFIDDDLYEFKLWAKKCSLIVFIQNEEVSRIEISLEDSNTNDYITTLNFTREEFEKEYDIKIQDLKKDSKGLEEVLQNII